VEAAALLILRVVMGSVFIAHGWPKAFGPAQGEHGTGRTENLLRSRGLPAPALLAKAMGYTEVIGGALVLVGAFTRFAVVPLIVIVAVAIPMVKWKKGFVDGWDWPFTLVGVGVAIAILGAGDVSVDALIGLPH
jgi:putative oxidoreductase